MVAFHTHSEVESKMEIQLMDVLLSSRCCVLFLDVQYYYYVLRVQCDYLYSTVRHVRTGC